MDNLVRYIDLDVVGENTKRKYSGRFGFKLFLTNKEELALNRKLETNVGKIAAAAYNWNYSGYCEAINNLKSEGEGDQEILINQNAKNIVMALVANYLPNTPVSANVLANCTSLTAYMVEFPDWWKELGYGQDLLDTSPISKLIEDFTKAKQAFLESDDE